MATDPIITPRFRLGFPHLFEAVAFKNSDPKFSAVMLFPEDADLTEMKAGARAVAVEKWGDKIPKDLVSPFRDGADKSHLDGYEAGVTFINAKANEDYPPQVVDRAKEPITDRREIYAGCYCVAVVVPFAYDVGVNKGVSFGLRAIQKTDDGPSFGGGGSELFDTLEDTPDNLFNKDEGTPDTRGDDIPF